MVQKKGLRELTSQTCRQPAVLGRKVDSLKRQQRATSWHLVQILVSTTALPCMLSEDGMSSLVLSPDLADGCHITNKAGGETFQSH